MNIYVGNLNYRVREDDLKQVMEEYGTVESVKIIKVKQANQKVLVSLKCRTMKLRKKQSPS